MSSIDLHLIHRALTYDLSLRLDDTLSVLHAHLESLTAVPSARQKLLYKGKKATHTPATTIRDAGLTNGIKVTMLGSTDQELGSMVKVENEQRRREQIMQDRASKRTVKARPTSNTYIATPHQHSLGAFRWRGKAQLIHLPQIGTARTSTEPHLCSGSPASALV
jgi:hypothetical protein